MKSIASKLNRSNLTDRLRVERGRGYGSAVIHYQSPKGKIQITKKVDDVHVLDYWTDIVKWLNYELDQKPTFEINCILRHIEDEL